MQIGFDRNNPPPLETLLDSARVVAESQHGDVLSSQAATVDGYPARRSSIRVTEGAAIATLTVVTDDRAFVVMFGSTEQAAASAEGEGVLNTFHLTHARDASVSPAGSPAPSTSSSPPPSTANERDMHRRWNNAAREAELPGGHEHRPRFHPSRPSRYARVSLRNAAQVDRARHHPQLARHAI
jgi:hypothetical protein